MPKTSAKKSCISSKQPQEFFPTNFTIPVKNKKLSQKKRKIYYLTEECITKIKKIASLTRRSENEIIEMMTQAVKVQGEK
ncbi:MAG: hypothetical protein LBC44_03855 [Mycoplasmataceae bacterium]|jgi:hypothetical protein|nr:hypothetical protein [Mycoplasmataceae bacterium]